MSPVRRKATLPSVPEALTLHVVDPPELCPNWAMDQMRRLCGTEDDTQTVPLHQSLKQLKLVVEMLCRQHRILIEVHKDLRDLRSTVSSAGSSLASSGSSSSSYVRDLDDNGQADRPKTHQGDR